MAQEIYFVPEEELQSTLTTMGERPFRSKQIREWLYKRFAIHFGEMQNLPLSCRQELTRHYQLEAVKLVTTESASDGTEKLLLELHDGETIEMVLIPSPERLTFCLSTQVGCPVRCRFCASGANGLMRNLTAGEILQEYVAGCRRAGQIPDNIVFMGIGEGLLNWNSLSNALERLTAPDGFGLSPRRITVSTSGYVPGIDKLTNLGKEFTLAISLHAPDDEVRKRIIPDPLRYPVAEILAAGDRYRQKTGRMVTFEYTLLAGINDQESHAYRLAELAKIHHAKINLIPYNATTPEFSRPADHVIRRFASILEKQHAHVTLRLEKGAKVAAACGQLRSRTKASK